MDVMEDRQIGENIHHTPTKMASMPGTPLQSLSPERLNQRLPASPSLPLKLDQQLTRHQHRLSDASDVKARIAYLNSMNGSPTRSPSPSKISHAAIQRAIVGREEAETALNAMIAQLESAKARERLVAERVESLMEQLQEARARQRHERQVYEKEMKTSKKSEYKAELAVIKLQEELKEAKEEVHGYRARAEHDKTEKEKARQEAFERAYAVAGMTEELQILKDKLQVVEEERDHAVATAASKMSVERDQAVATNKISVNVKVEPAKEISKDVNKAAAEAEENWGLVLNPATGTYYEPLSKFTFLDEIDLDDPKYPLEMKNEVLQRKVGYLKRQRAEYQETINFMHIQCQFLTCPCRMAERNGKRYVHDHVYDAKMRARDAKRRKVEDDKPLPEGTSQSRKTAIEQNQQTVELESQLPNSQHTRQVMDVDGEEQRPTPAVNLSSATEPVAPLPPAQILADESQCSEQLAEALEAARIPLPTTNEDTAQLEEFTQVMVEPSAAIRTFHVPLANPARIDFTEATPKLMQTQSTTSLSEELFNLSPPKYAPPRPSTAMGIISVDSPIRLVPLSPPSRSAHGELPSLFAQSQTTRVALNDTSSSQATRHQQQHWSHSRPSVRNQSRAWSPSAERDEARPASALDAHSPASSTVFPITPVSKHPRRQPQPEVAGFTQLRNHDLHQHQTHLNGGLVTNETTTTTTVPLRGDDESVELTYTQTSASSAATGPGGVLRDGHNVPGTPISREAALAQIRARRDRARSVNMRKAEQDAHPDGERRGTKTPGSAARRGVKIDLGHRLGIAKQGERGRDVSQASAPGRF